MMNSNHDEDNNEIFGTPLASEETVSLIRSVCRRLDQNDSSLTELEDWSKFGIHGTWRWDQTELQLLGRSLFGNTHLRSLTFEAPFDQLYSYTSAGVLRRGIAAASQLQHLRLSRIHEYFQKLLLEAVAVNPMFRHLEILDVRMVDICSIANLLRSQGPSTDAIHAIHCRLTRIELTNCCFDDMDMLKLSLGLAENRQLYMLALDHNEITNIGIMYFCQHWKHDSPLQQLRLSKNRIGTKGVLELLQQVTGTRHQALHDVMLACNTSIGHDGLAQIGALLPSITLPWLDLTACVPDSHLSSKQHVLAGPQRAACRALADGLRANTSLQRLFLGANDLGATGAHMILQAATVHRPVLDDMSFAVDQSLGYEGIKLIASELPHTPIKGLHLDALILPSWPEPQDKLAREAGQALLRGVKNNTTLTSFSFQYLHPMWLKPIEFHVGVNRTCRPLLAHLSSVPSYWPLILSLFDRKGRTSHMFFLLVEQPWLFCPRQCGDE